MCDRIADTSLRLVRLGSTAWPYIQRAMVRFSNGVIRRLPHADWRARGRWLECSNLPCLALGDQVLGRDLELLRQCHGFGAPVRQRQIVDLRPDRIGMAFDRKYLSRIAAFGPPGSPARSQPIGPQGNAPSAAGQRSPGAAGATARWKPVSSGAAPEPPAGGRRAAASVAVGNGGCPRLSGGR